MTPYLFGLVAEAVGLVGPSRVGHLGDAGQLTVFPRAYAQHEAEHIALLLPPELFQVLVSAHACNRSLVPKQQGRERTLECFATHQRGGFTQPHHPHNKENHWVDVCRIRGIELSSPGGDLRPRLVLVLI